MAAPWMFHYNIVNWGHLVELGFPARKTLEANSAFLIGEVLDPGYNPYLTEAYILPVRMVGQRGFFTNWAQVKSAFQPDYAERRMMTALSAENGYAYVALAAGSFIVPFTYNSMKGADAYDWLQENIPRTGMRENPKWAIIPRSVPQADAGVSHRRRRQ
jgi:hypothetical protein